MKCFFVGVIWRVYFERCWVGASGFGGLVLCGFGWLE